MWLFRRDNSTTATSPFVVPTTGDFEGNDGSWSTFMINVGLKDAQNFRVLVSTSSSSTWVPLPAGCGSNDPSNCPQLRGVEDFAGAKSPGYSASDGQEIGIYALKLGTSDFSAVYGSNYTGINATFYSDVEGLGPYSNTTPEESGSVIAGVVSKNLFMGSLGLNTVSINLGTGDVGTFLASYGNASQSQIPSTSFGYTAGASYHSGFYGNLVMGGYDASRFTMPSHSYGMSSTNNSLDLTVQSIIIDSQSNSQSATVDTNDFGHNFRATIDSTFPYLWLPPVVCDRFQSIFGLAYDNATDLYTINDTSRKSNLQSSPTITIKLAESATSSNFTSIKLSYKAFDQQASWPIYPNATNYFPIRRSQTGVYILGRTILQESYLLVDYDRKNFSLGQASFPASVPTASIVAIRRPAEETQPQKSSKSSSFPVGAIVGIVIGVLIVAVLVVAFFLFRRHLKRRKQKRMDDATVDHPSMKYDDLSLMSPGTTQSNFRGGRSSVFSEGETTVSSELAGRELRPIDETTPIDGFYGPIAPKRVSELESPDPKNKDGYFGHRKLGSSDTTPSELEVKNVIHELPADMPRVAEAPSVAPSEKGATAVKATEVPPKNETQDHDAPPVGSPPVSPQEDDETHADPIPAITVESPHSPARHEDAQPHAFDEIQPDPIPDTTADRPYSPVHREVAPDDKEMQG
jgi:Eukaryotic aspartyl protease